MRRILTIAGIIALMMIGVNRQATAQIGTWRAYMSYYEPQQIVKAGNNTLFVRASNSLYSYNLNDHSISTYDKVGILNDTHIEHIAWSQQAKRLIIIYDNANIDLMDLNENITNISSLYTKALQDKTINAVYVNEQYAFLAMTFGIVKINMERAEISDTYKLNQNINAINIADGNIYARTKEGIVLTAPMTVNLLDRSQWQQTATYPAFSTANADWDTYLPTVQTLKPGGPKNNNFGFMMFKDNLLYTASGKGSTEMPATVQIKNSNGDWQFLQDDMTGVEGTGGNWKFVNMYAVDIDPFDSKHIFAGSRTGLFEYYDGQLVKYYNKDNSILKTATTSNRYVIVSSVLYDEEGNLWLLQADVKENSIIEIKKDGEWVKHDQSLLMYEGESLPGLQSLYKDSRGLIWFTNSHWQKSSFYCYDPATDQIVNYMVDLVNQDGTSIESIYNPASIVEDLDHNMWLCTNKGLFLIEADRISNTLEYVTQVKVPRNDGTNYADYLLDGVDVTCLAVDGGNRKWIGTVNGIYLISADNMEQVYHFTTNNSNLLSNNIRSIAIDPTSGEVFIGTDQGLCSYLSDATTAAIEMNKDDVYAYPNPVVSGYNGLITVKGLSYDADVKILTTNGILVAEGRSNGGTFTWNGRDRQGRRVASGIYMVAAATNEGKKGVVCKIAIIN